MELANNDNQLNNPFAGLEEELPEVASAEKQSALKEEAGGNYESDPHTDRRIIPVVKIGKDRSLIWDVIDEVDRTKKTPIFGHDTHFVVDKTKLTSEGKYKGGSNLRIVMSDDIMAIKFEAIRPRTGLQHGYYDETSGRGVNFCRSIASFKGEEVLFSDHPLEVALYGPREYEEGKKNYEAGEAHKLVKENGLYGQKGMSCENCVRAGEHSKEVELANGESKMVTCEAENSITVKVVAFAFKYTPRSLSTSESTGDKIVWRNWDEIYDKLEDEDGNVELQPIFNFPPFIRVQMSRTQAVKTSLDVATCDNSKPNTPSSFVPSDVSPLKGFQSRLRKETLADGYPWIKVIKDHQNPGNTVNLYRGQYELWICQWSPHVKPEDTLKGVNHVAMFRISDESVANSDNAEKVQYEMDRYAWTNIRAYRSFVDNKAKQLNINPRTPFIPKEISEMRKEPSLTDSSRGDSPKQISASDVDDDSAPVSNTPSV